MQRRPVGRLEAILLLVAVAALAAAGLKRLWPAGDSGKRTIPPAVGPNVLLIVLDTSRADHFSLYGKMHGTTPRIDALAEQGIAYASAYSTDCWTLPSHATILSGLYPSEAGATSETNYFPQDNYAIAERMRDAGYRTGAVVCNAWLSRERGFDQGFDDFVEVWRQLPQTVGGVDPREDHSAADQVVAHMKEYAKGIRPFFMFVNFNVAHLPYCPPERLKRWFVPPGHSPSKVRRIMEITDEWPFLVGELALDDADFEILRGLYAGGIAQADEWVGLLLDALREEEIFDETLIIVTSDHGENLGEHDRIGHTLSMHETTLHVPLIMRFPNVLEKRLISDSLVSLVDLTPTVLDVCGIAYGDDVRLGLRRNLAKPSSAGREFVYAENAKPVNGVSLVRKHYPSFDASSIDYATAVLRTDRYKMIWDIGSRVQLFDLWADRGESTNIADQQPALCQEIHAELKGFMESLATAEPQEGVSVTDEAALEELRSLGYIE